MKLVTRKTSDKPTRKTSKNLEWAEFELRQRVTHWVLVLACFWSIAGTVMLGGLIYTGKVEIVNKAIFIIITAAVGGIATGIKMALKSSSKTKD